MVTKVCSHHYVCSSICFYTGIKRQDTAKANSAFLLKDHRPKVRWKQMKTLCTIVAIAYIGGAELHFLFHWIHNRMFSDVCQSPTGPQNLKNKVKPAW